MVRTEAEGPGAVGETDQTWAEFSKLMEESKADTEQALAEAGASWEGLAVESMTAGVTPLAQWAGDAGTASTASNASVRQVSEAFAHTSNSMPEPVPVTSTANSDFGGLSAGFVHLFGGQTDQDKQERAAQEAKQRAVELMNAYSTEADSAVGSVGTFVPPQSVVVAVPPPSVEPGQVHSTDGEFVGPSGRQGKTGGTGVITGDYNGIDGPPGGESSAGRTVVEPSGRTTTSSAGPVAPVGPTPVTGGQPTVGGGSGGPGNTYPPGTGLPISGTTGRPGMPASDGRGGLRPGGSGQGGRPAGGTSGGEHARGGRGAGSTGGGGEHARGGRGAVGGLAEDGHRSGARGGLGAAGEHGAGTRGGAAAGRGGVGAGAMGSGGAGAKSEEDLEHFSPTYLHDQHDDFWDDNHIVAPPVIGE
ncbi:PPE domain-containing protein [Actinokineospora sp.]|uniref:PPE domain-containing protein n=1 Tax=Actinokineospora sp. TaxID=1872133 RepID=UPI003D6B3FDF